MPTYFAKQFGAYVYDDLRDGLGQLKNVVGYRHRQSKAFSQDGAFALNSLHDPRRLSFEGVLTGANGAQDAASLRAALDLFLAAHQAGPAQQLAIDNDRYINAQVETFEDDFDGLSHHIALTFLCFDPFWYSTTTTTEALTVGGTTVITTGGTVYSLPVVTLVATAAGGIVTLANAQDATLTFSPPAAGTFTLDCLQETITDAGGTDQTAYFTGDLIRLIAGQLASGGTATNSLTLTTAGGAALSSASISWADRWL